MFVSKQLLIRPLLAAGLLTTAVLGTAAPAGATSLYAADLTVGVTSLPSSSVASGANMVYTLTINNLATAHRVCEVEDTVPPRTTKSVSTSNAVVMKPELSLWIDLSRKVGLNINTGYMIARPRVTVSSTAGTGTNRVKADM